MEQRGVLEGTFVLPDGDTIVMACTHFEAFDSVCRAAQTQFVERHFAHATHPTILAGDFNAPPSDMVIRQLTAQWDDCTVADPTFSTKKPKDKIDYIFARPQSSWRTIRSQVIPVVMSDHFPVIATLVVTRE
ncbi:MAG: endonuclease/exonuclease/phosphatase family protein, partial [Muribaculaceae bacterium]|nr:endonuclease/exonuclease/phosphatase family protein [Muribaculaceae bacterium]